MINFEAKTTVVADVYEQVSELDMAMKSGVLNALNIFIIGDKEGSPDEELLRALQNDCHPIMAVVLGQVVEIGSSDFYSRPHQEGVQHGPFPPIDSEDTKAQALHQLDRLSWIVGDAWYKRAISDESAAVIDLGIQRALQEIHDPQED